MVGPFGDVAELHLDVELRERLLHEARALHELLLRFARHEVRLGVVQQIQRRQLIVANHAACWRPDGLLLGHHFRFREHGREGRLHNRGICSRDGRGSVHRDDGFWHGRRLGFSTSVLCALGIFAFAQNVRRGGCGDFLGRDHHAFVRGKDLLHRFHSFARRLRLFRCRDAEVANRRFRYGLQIGAERNPIFIGFFCLAQLLGFVRLAFRAFDLFLEFARLLFQFLGALFQLALLIGHAGLIGRLFLEHGAQPDTKLEIGEVKQADDVNSQINDRRAGASKVAEQLIQPHAHDSPGSGGAKIESRVLEKARARMIGVAGEGHHDSLIGEQGQETNAAEKQNHTPRPASTQVMERVPEAADAKEKAENWQDERGGAERLEKEIRDPRPRRTDQVVWRYVVIRGVRHVVPIKGRHGDE